MPKHEILVKFFFTTVQCYLGRMFRVQKDFINPSCFASVFHFFENTRMPGIRIQFVHVHWAYTYELYAYAQHSLTKRMRMLSIRLRKNTSKSYGSYAYAEHTLKKMDISKKMLCYKVLTLKYLFEFSNFFFLKLQILLLKLHTQTFILFICVASSVYNRINENCYLFFQIPYL